MRARATVPADIPPGVSNGGERSKEKKMFHNIKCCTGFPRQQVKPNRSLRAAWRRQDSTLHGIWRNRCTEEGCRGAARVVGTSGWSLEGKAVLGIWVISR